MHKKLLLLVVALAGLALFTFLENKDIAFYGTPTEEVECWEFFKEAKPIASRKTSVHELEETCFAHQEGDRVITRYEVDLVSYDAEGKKTIVIANLENRITPSYQGGSLKVYSAPVGTSKLFFVSTVPFSDAPPGPIHVVDLLTKEVLGPLRVCHPYGRLSPDGLRVAFVATDPERLVWCDLLLDEELASAELEEGESLFGSVSAFDGEPQAEFEWKDNSTVEYSVFDASEPLITSDLAHKRTLLEKRLLK